MNKRKKALKNLEKIVSNMGKNWGYLLWRMTILTHLPANVLNAFGKVMTGTWYFKDGNFQCPSCNSEFLPRE